MPKWHAPHRGSKAFRRCRAARIYPRVSTWPKTDKVTLLGFPAYKVGMCTVYEKVLDPRSPWHGIERAVAATVLEAPPVRVMAVRVYTLTPYGYRALTEVWTHRIFDWERKYLARVFPLPKRIDEKYVEEKINQIWNYFDQGLINRVRVLVRTRPGLTGIGQKKPWIVEIQVGGPIKEALEYALGLLGKSVDVTQVFQPRQYVDVIGVTKGYGFQGVVKRHGVAIPWRGKKKKEYRAVGSLGPITPGRVFWTVPRYGQYGFFRRTEYNKEILSIIPLVSDFIEERECFLPDELEQLKKMRIELAMKYAGVDDPSKLPRRFIMTFAPKGGFKHYGLPRNTVLIVRGSTVGPPKRMLILRHPVRPKRIIETEILRYYYGREEIGVRIIPLPS